MTTDANEDLKAEVDRLRAEVESHRQRELDDLKAQLAAARGELEKSKQEANHLRNECLRNIQEGYKIDSTHLETIRGLEKEIIELKARRNAQS
jgi:cell division septum initiation protein DivIVA